MVGFCSQIIIPAVMHKYGQLSVDM